MILGAMNADGVLYAKIFGLVADTSIELGARAMCPALYAIKYPFFKYI
jgi:hypothetical protein